MCEIKTVLFVAALILAATGFCIYRVSSGKKVGHNSETKSESLCEKVHKKFCLNGGDCYYLVDEDVAACDCTWLYGREHCEKYIWWT